MNISHVINPNYNFGRALTTKEKTSYASLINAAKKEANIQDTTAIVFDFNVPSEKGFNTGIGTTFSNSMVGFTSFVKDMTGINSIQLQPQGTITSSNYSPYSGSNYAYGEHIIDLKKMTTSEYGNLLDKKDIVLCDEMYTGDKAQREFKADYKYVLGNEQKIGIQRKLLKKAFDNFTEKSLSADKTVTDLNNELSLFKVANEDWLMKYSLFEVLANEVYSSTDISKWNEIDRCLFDNSTSEEQRQTRIQELENQYSDSISFIEFEQFIADKQQKQSKKAMNSLGVKLYGDCLIGFSQGEMWANKSCFRENLYYGGPDKNCVKTNGIQVWGLPALDYTKLGECNDVNDLSKLGEVGKLLFEKFSLFFSRYDGIRMDAAWQFATPFVYQQINGNYEQVETPEINFTIFNIMKAAAKNILGDKFDEQNPDNIMLELVGGSSAKSREMTQNMYPHIYTTAFSEYDERPKKFLEKGYQNGKFSVGVGCHDNDSLMNMAKDSYARCIHLNDMKSDYPWFKLANLKFRTDEYRIQDDETKKQEDYRTAKFSEIFTSAKNFFTLPDMFGMQERINISGKADNSNWRVRIPSNYEKFYFSQLSKGFGLNLPKALANALRMQKSSNVQLIKKCDEAAEILRSEGPNTEKEANRAYLNGKLKGCFEYSV